MKKFTYPAYTTTWAKRFITNFPEDTIELVKEYKDKIDDLHVVELRDDDWVETSNQDEIARLHYRYSTIAYVEGYVEDIDDFDKLYIALCLLDREVE